MKLLEAFEFAGLSLKNRMIMAPMAPAMGDFDEAARAYYLRRARGGAAMIVVNAAGERGMESELPTALLTEESFEGFRELVHSAHESDCRVCVQIQPGSGLGARLGGRMASASAVEIQQGSGKFFEELTREDIRALQDEMAKALALAKRAGVDAVELHAHGGYLTDRFLTRRWNIRRDEYGGSLDGRMRFLDELIDVTRGVMGEDFPLIVKFTPCHFLPPEAGYRGFDEGLEIARRLEARGVNALHVDAGCHDNWFLVVPPVYQVDIAPQIFACMKVRGVTKLPLITNGKLDDPDRAENVLRAGKVDVIAIGRGLLADPELPNKIKNHRPDDIRPCIACNEGCIKSVTEGRHIDCAVNPLTGFELTKAIEKTHSPKRVLVIGAGPGGCQAAISAREAGHEVELWDASSYIGGNFHNATRTPFKRSGARLLDYYRTTLDRLGVTVKYLKEATAESVCEFNPNKIIYAAGGVPLRPESIPGIDSGKVQLATDVLRHHAHVGDRVAVIGGGLVGVEVAVMLAFAGKKVNLIEMREALLMESVFIQNRMMLTNLLQNPNITVHTKTSLTQVTDTAVHVQTVRGELVLPCDSVVLAMGFEPNTALYDELSGKYDVVNIGDSREVAMVIDAVREGHDAARGL